MNRYGAQLMRQWQQSDPERYQAIEDKQEFFEQLGSEAQREIETLAAAIAGPDRPGESYLENGSSISMQLAPRTHSPTHRFAEVRPDSCLVTV